ncbi:MAG: nitrogen fixation protein NifX [Oceanospirillaceae bacterium]|nr:nitrogen fixation protein NifX [Oceanospirillaceae bacterium]MBT14314.1 nitrogen fixation protein NifX [Oceanospirillaceae bacterium]|tara:strand:+ start:84277 stop:84750 length:474 start_codon:yes stop_codon:yes gene_type:complete
MTVTRKLQVVDDEDDSALLKVAFASSDRTTVDQHFGSACAFVIYGVSPEQSKLLQVSEFGELSADVSEDKLSEKLDILDGCIAVYCRACGASAVRQLLVQGIQPVKVSEGTGIAELIGHLQQELREGPSSWLAKAMRSHQLAAGARFDDMEAEGWKE